MPFTLFAHQAPAIPLKLARPRWFDGTALCIGSMSPDLAYSVSRYFHADTHEGWAVLWLSVPTAIVFTIAARVSASTVVAQLPDLGPYRVWSWRVLSTRWPAWWVTLHSVVIGVGTHLFLDGFTHRQRWGARLLGYDDVQVAVLGHHLWLTSMLQAAGHIVGGLVSVLLLRMIGRRCLLEEWYGAAAVERARVFNVDRRRRFAFWSVVAAGFAVGVAWGWNGERVEIAVRPMVTLAAAATLAHFLPASRVGSPRSSA